MPGADLEVQALDARVEVLPPKGCLLLVNVGKVIVDLPNGEFRVLDVGDSLMLPVATPVALQPVAGQAILIWHHPR